MCRQNFLGADILHDRGFHIHFKLVTDVRFGKINFGLNIYEVGKTVFLTKEEAEQALKGGAE